MGGIIDLLDATARHCGAAYIIDHRHRVYIQYRYNYYTAQQLFDEISIRSITVENSKASPGQDSFIQLIRPQLLEWHVCFYILKLFLKNFKYFF